MKEAKKESVVGDTLTKFEAHTLLITEEKTTRNNLRRRAIIFDNRKQPHAPSKACGSSNALAVF
jgi:hypothetical protein